MHPQYTEKNSRKSSRSGAACFQTGERNVQNGQRRWDSNAGNSHLPHRPRRARTHTEDLYRELKNVEHFGAVSRRLQTAERPDPRAHFLAVSATGRSASSTSRRCSICPAPPSRTICVRLRRARHDRKPPRAARRSITSAARHHADQAPARDRSSRSCRSPARKRPSTISDVAGADHPPCPQRADGANLSERDHH